MTQLLKRWSPLAAAIVVLSATIYGVAHQVLRQGGNDPQIQMAREAAAALASGAAPASVVPRGTPIDLNNSLAPFISVYDDSGKSLESSGVLSGAPPVPPAGVFEFTRAHKEDHITWQPEPTVRIAIVAVRYEGVRPGFVIVGRSIAEVERRELQVAVLAEAGCILALIASLIAKRIVS